VASGAAVLAGVALWKLGIEFERAWIRSYESPLLGETSIGELVASSQHAQIGQEAPVGGERRRWVASHHARGAARAPHPSR
jgi:hypothetical protein